MILHACQFKFTFPRPALVMGIVNVTLDSFSDGGKFFSATSAVEHGLKLISQGADILDIGGESTRPNAASVGEAEELRRVLPVIEALAARVKIPLSIDTMKPGVARAALQAGASIVNDVAANSRGGGAKFQVSSVQFGLENLKLETGNSTEMWRVVAEAGAGYVCMHMQGTPPTMQAAPAYGDVVREVADFFFERLERMSGCGLSREQIILDAGIGFGKTLEHNLQLLGGIEHFQNFGRPLLVGASRKSFIGTLLGSETADRLPASLACASLAVAAGAHIIRAHDVAETVQTVRMTEALAAGKKK